MSDFLYVGAASTKQEIQDHFSKVAERLLNGHVLWINSKPYRLLEIEFYLNSVNHPDTFTHGDPQQSKRGEWYFHKQGKNYKSGTYKGLDIAFGQGDASRGGILLRAMIPLNPNDFEASRKMKEKKSALKHQADPVDGPCTLVNKILEEGKVVQIDDLVILKEFSHNCFIVSEEEKKESKAEKKQTKKAQKKENKDEEKEEEKKKEIKKEKATILFIEACDDLEKFEVLSGPRVGLSLKRTDAHKKEYVMKSYRYFTSPHLLKKGKNLMMLPLLAENKTKQEIVRKLKVTQKSVENHRSAYERGFKGKKKVAEFEKKNLSNEEITELYGVWKRQF